MAISLGKAAEIFAHYIEEAMRVSGASLSGEGRDELRKAVEAFASADTSLAGAIDREARR